MEATMLLRLLPRATRNISCLRLPSASYSTLRSGAGPRSGPRNRLVKPNTTRTNRQHPLYQEYDQPPQNHGFEGEGPDPLLAPVNIPHDPHGVLTLDHPAAGILSNSAIIIQRQLELGNLLLGFEQANKYVILDPQGNHIGFIAEEESGIAKILQRQWFRTHRAFTAHVFDKHQKEVLVFRRPFSFINSRIQVWDLQNAKLVGEAHQEWALLRRKYNLFLSHDPPTPSSASPAGTSLEKYNPNQETTMTQFAYVDEPLLSWDFSLLDQSSTRLGSVNRNFGGFGREIFTDTGSYVLQMDSVGQEVLEVPGQHWIDDGRVITGDVAKRGMTLDERAVMLATAVCIDFDYFSRHSSVGSHGAFGGHGGFMPIWFPGTGSSDLHQGDGGEQSGGISSGVVGGEQSGGTSSGVSGSEQNGETTWGESHTEQSGETTWGETGSEKSGETTWGESHSEQSGEPTWGESDSNDGDWGGWSD
ncbi:Scramblase-domain-containing protein [Ascobolus immersus RN42]|uniref:Scramblase-domain-containing protein n=1 Tax=Ascobolus immersus RN42 TaxID=1160509 RepID=A0A3N4IJG7_ASCIM|nr:Scramblase-domain-containing protein [Ascobolus immersus RN42]